MAGPPESSLFSCVIQHHSHMDGLICVLIIGVCLVVTYFGAISTGLGLYPEASPMPTKKLQRQI